MLRDSVTYHNITALSSHLKEKICALFLAFYELTDSDFAKAFRVRSKRNSFKKLLSKPENVDLISSLNSYQANVEKMIHFLLHLR